MNKLISSTFHGRPSTRRLAFSCPTNGSGSGKTERGAVYMSPCVLCYSKSRNNKVQACPHAPPPPASGEGRDARVRFYWLQFGDNANAVADNRGRWRGSSVEKQKQSSRISATVVSKQVAGHQSATGDDVSACRRVLIAGLRGWWSGRSGLGSGPAAVRRSTGKQGEEVKSAGRATVRGWRTASDAGEGGQWGFFCATYTDEVVLWEATRGDVVLQQLLGEVLVHLRCFVGIHCVSQGLV